MSDIHDSCREITIAIVQKSTASNENLIKLACQAYEEIYKAIKNTRP